MTLGIILASASPRRRELLRLIGLQHDIMIPDVDESVLPGEDPAAYVERVARDKALAVPAQPGATVIISADTTVVIDDDILGKPADETEARAMLRRLSGRTHAVYTAVAVRRGGELRSGVETVAVTFRHLGDAEIQRYVSTGEPMDKAGSYGIQGYGATIVERIDGDYFAVMGLSLVRMVTLMRDVGARYEFGVVTDEAR